MMYVIAIVSILIAVSGVTFFLNEKSQDTGGFALNEEWNDVTTDTAANGEVADVAPQDTVRPSGNTLDLSNQSLTSVPSSVFEKRTTEVLNLSGNKLTGALPAEVRHLSNLKVLDFSDNQFTGIPAEVGQLANLEILDVSNNPITGLPYEIGNLKKLKTLDLRGTQYASQDLGIIRENLPATVNILVD